MLRQCPEAGRSIPEAAGIAVVGSFHSGMGLESETIKIDYLPSPPPSLPLSFTKEIN